MGHGPWGFHTLRCARGSGNYGCVYRGTLKDGHEAGHGDDFLKRQDSLLQILAVVSSIEKMEQQYLLKQHP